MKAKKKPAGIKQKIREEKKKEQRTALAFAVAILIIIISISGFFVNSMLNQPSTNQTIPPNISEPKAAIVDHLSLTAPNQTFIQTATTTLKQAGYAVDYYSGEKVTVEFYRNLPTHNYGLIILRVHSALAYSEEGQERREMGFVDLFSSELYSTNRYIYEQLTDQISKAVFPDGGPEYFGISPPFIWRSMKGRFNNTLIIMMGCNGLTYTSLASAFVEKGAKAYISWNASVSASHTDKTTACLLQHLIIGKQTIVKAVTETMKQVGPDTAYNSVLLYYPHETENDTIEPQ